MTSHAKTVSNTPINAPSPRRSFKAATQTDAEKTKSRDSVMVTNDRPAPVPRPSPDLAHDVDRAAFKKRWEDEARAARREAFMAKRKHQTSQTRGRTVHHAVKR